MKNSHKKKFERWQERVPMQTRRLSSLVEESIVPVLEKAGFELVDIALSRKDEPVSANELRLEKNNGEHIDSIYIDFEKHKSPQFQIGFSRRALSFPNEFVRSGNLVKNSDQYYFFWGKPWWCLLAFWSEKNSKQTVDEIVTMLPQIFAFLENDKRGKNISKEVKVSLRTSAN